MRSPADAYSELASLAARFVKEDGEVRTAIEGLSLSRRSTPSIPCHGSYRPCLAMVLQGAKSLQLGSATINYTTGEYLVTSLDLPVTWRVSEASVEAPHLCLSLAIDSEKLVNLLGQMDIRRNSISTEAKRELLLTRRPLNFLMPWSGCYVCLKHPVKFPLWRLF